MTTKIDKIKSKLDPRVIAAINKYFPEDQRDMAMAVAWEESNGKADAIGTNSDSKDHGIFQINDKWHPEVKNIDPYDIDENIKLAADIQKKKGWDEWNTKNKAMGNLNTSLFDAANYIKGGIEDSSIKYSKFKTASYDPSMGSFNKSIEGDNLLKEFQKFLGVKEDGMYGPITDRASKNFFTSINPDNLVDDENDENNIEDDGIVPTDISATEKQPSVFDDNPLFNPITKSFGARGVGGLTEDILNSLKPKEGSVGSEIESDNYFKSINENQKLGTALEIGKLGTNLGTYIRNSRTSAPSPLKAESIPLLSANFMNADYSQINQDLVRMLGATREGGGNVANLSPLLRGATDAKLKLGATTNKFNIQERARAEGMNTDITAKNVATKLGVDQYNREANLKLGAVKGALQTSLMQSMFDNATNMVAYREKAAKEKDAVKRYLKDYKLEEKKLYIDKIWGK
ncbi:MAG: hypothetical protein JXR64_02935 [Spirochaetales bacterium]|nr:hypothetical protein [Spirochaetales bacterium]